MAARGNEPAGALGISQGLMRWRENIPLWLRLSLGPLCVFVCGDVVSDFTPRIPSPEEGSP